MREKILINKKIFFDELKKSNNDDIESFVQLGLKYMNEIGRTDEGMGYIEKYRHIWSKECDDPDEYFLRSIVKKIGENERWLIQLKSEGAIIGFVHAKIDRDEKIGTGYIMEFYISENHRMYGYGNALYKYIEDIFKSKEVESVWLEAHNESSIRYWKHLGFLEVENNHPEITELSKSIVI